MASDIIAPKAQSSVRSSTTLGCTTLSWQRREIDGTLPLERQGSVFGNHSTGKPNRAGSNLPRDDCRCPVPPAMTHGGGSWRSGSAATSLPWSRLPRDLLHLRALRSRAPLLQRFMPPASPPPATAIRQQTTPTESRRATGSPRPPAGIPLPPSSSAIARDGSRFPFDHFPGIIRLWIGPHAVKHPPMPRWQEIRPWLWPRCRICGRTGRFIDPFPRIHVTKVSHCNDQSGNPRTDSPLLLRRALEDRHYRQ